MFREIAFKSQLKKEDAEEYGSGIVESQNENVIWTKANTNRCTQCHGQNPSPIFDTYFLWPGFYGSNDDFLTTVFVREEITSNGNYNGSGLDKVFGESQGRDVKLKAGVPDVEVQGYKDFLSGKHRHARYDFLPDRGIDKGFYRWMNGEPAESIDVSADVRFDMERASHGPNLQFFSRPNLLFMNLLQRQMREKFLRQLYTQPKWQRKVEQLVYMENCNFSVSAVPPLGIAELPKLKDFIA